MCRPHARERTLTGAPLCRLCAVLQVRWEECDRCQARIQQVGGHLCGLHRSVAASLCVVYQHRSPFPVSPCNAVTTTTSTCNMPSQEGLASEAELQSWFVRRISSYLARHNRRIIGEAGRGGGQALGKPNPYMLALQARSCGVYAPQAHQTNTHHSSTPHP